ncbi:MAG: OstA-like protein [Ignavibacteria bacterium]
MKSIDLRQIRTTIIFLIFILFSFNLYEIDIFAQDKITLNHADSLMGKVIDGEQVREAVGNVSLTHNNVQIFCSRVIQFTEQNKAELYGNVKVFKDTLSIYAPAGIYYGNEGKVVCPNGSTLNDSKVTLKANHGTYLFSQDIAYFRGNVKIYDSKSYTITSDELNYYRTDNKSIASGNVKIVTDSSVIYSDNLIYEKSIGKSFASGNVKIESDSTVINSNKLTYYEFEKKSIAEENVKINFLNKNAVIYGLYSENYEITNYSFVKGKAKLVQIEKKEGRIDTLFIYSEKMESFRNKPEYYIANDSVKIIRSDFYSNSQIGYYFKDTTGTGGVVSLSRNPAVWKDELQVTGDSIYAFFKDDLEKIYVNKSAFALQNNKNYENRYDQISGVFMFLKFIDNEINYIQVDTNAASIYFVYDNEKPNGANKSNGEVISMYFKDKKINKVKVVGLPEGTYFPEFLVNLAELRLLGFNIRYDKPLREQ